MEDWNEDQDVITRMSYRERTVKVVVSDVQTEAIRFIDMDGLANMDFMVALSRDTMESFGQNSLAMLMMSIQLIAVQLIDRQLDNPL